MNIFVFKKLFVFNPKLQRYTKTKEKHPISVMITEHQPVPVVQVSRDYPANKMTYSYIGAICM